MRAIDAQGHAEAESESLDTQAVILEMILMQLRLNEGLSIESFRRRTGHDPRELFGGALGRLVDQRSLVVSDHAISLTRQGRLICNAVMTELATVLPLERSSQVA